MRHYLATLAFLTAALVASQGAFAQKEVDRIRTNFRWVGPDDSVLVERYDDPKIANVSCYMSRAQTGGVTGGLGWAENPSNFSIACRATGPIEIPDDLPEHGIVGVASSSAFYKVLTIHRAVDKEKNVLIYTVVSTKLINGSPFNSISVIPVFK
jgi:CreA protein